MKKHSKLTFLIIALLILAIAAFIYKQPVEIEKMYNDWNFDKCTSIDVYAKYSADGKYHSSGNFDISGFTLEKDDCGFDDIIALFETKELIRSFGKVKRVNINYGQVGIDWAIAFNAENGRLEFTDYEGEQTALNDCRISIDPDDPWLKEVFETAVKYVESDVQEPAV